MNRARRPSLLPYAVPIASVAAALWVRMWVNQAVEGRIALLPFLLPVIISSWFGGLMPGLFATVLGGIVGTVVFLEPIEGMLPGSTAAWVHLGFYAVTGVMISILSGALFSARQRAEERAEEIRANERVRAQLASIVETSNDAILSKNLDGIIETWNPAAERMYGYTADEAIGQSVAIIIPPELKGELPIIMDRLRRREFIQDYETVRVHRDGHRIEVSVSISPLTDHAGKVIGASAIARDIGERKRLEAARRASERRFGVMADTAPVLIWRSGHNGDAIWFNRRWLEFTGRPMEQAVQDGWAYGVHPEDLGDCTATYSSALDAQAPFQMEYRRKRFDGEYRWVLDTGIPLRDDAGHLTGYIGSCVDITELKRAEGERERLFSREQKARLDAEKADQAKDRYLATLAHELRNPLASISNALHETRLRIGSDPAVAKPISVAVHQTEHIARLIDDLLDVTRINQGKIALQPQPVDLGAAVSSALQGIRARIEDKGLTLVESLEDGVMVRADPTRLEQVLTNLVVNSLKYTEHGSITVSVTRLDLDAVFSVTDTGLGIPRDLLPQVFDLFTQGERSLDRSDGGLGIGLNLVREMVQMHGGTVEAFSEGEGRGSTFTVRLPLWLGAQAETGVPDGEAPFMVTRRNILVVDDNTDAAESLVEILEMWGHTASSARDGHEALNALRRVKPDVVLLDIGLPGMDGYEVARRMRAETNGNCPRIIALTGYGLPDDHRRTQEAGFDGHAVKPVDPVELRKLLSRTG